jgi:hypothetical protein
LANFIYSGDSDDDDDELVGTGGGDDKWARFNADTAPSMANKSNDDIFASDDESDDNLVHVAKKKSKVNFLIMSGHLLSALHI